MNTPVDSDSAFLRRTWTAVNLLVERGPRWGSLAGSVLYPIDVALAAGLPRTVDRDRRLSQVWPRLRNCMRLPRYRTDLGGFRDVAILLAIGAASVIGGGWLVLFPSRSLAKYGRGTADINRLRTTWIRFRINRISTHPESCLGLTGFHSSYIRGSATTQSGDGRPIWPLGIRHVSGQSRRSASADRAVRRGLARKRPRGKAGGSTTSISSSTTSRSPSTGRPLWLRGSDVAAQPRLSAH